MTTFAFKGNIIIWISLTLVWYIWISLFYNFIPIFKWLLGSLWSMKVKEKSLSRVQLFVTPWTVAYQTPLSMGFSRQECWSGLPFPSPGDLPNPGINPRSPALQADALLSEPPGKFYNFMICINYLHYLVNKLTWGYKNFYIDFPKINYITCLSWIIRIFPFFVGVGFF